MSDAIPRSPGKHVEDEILYGSGGGGQYQHTGREAPGSTGGYYGGTGSTGGESQNYNRERDSIPSQPSTAQEYNKTEDEYAQAEKERAAKSAVAREQSAKEKEAFYRQGEERAVQKEKQSGHRKQRSGEHKESRNPYTQQAVDPRLGEGSEQSQAARQVQTQAQPQAQPQAYAAGYAPTDTTTATQNYEREDATSRGGKGAAAAGLAGAAGAAGVAGAAGHSKQGYSGTTAPQENSPAAEVIGRTVSGNHEVERTASGQYRTRMASIIDPNSGQGVTSSESAYEHTPSGGGAYQADKFHERESRVASVTLPDGNKYTDPEADENYGLGYSSKLPGGVAYKAPAGLGYGAGAGLGGANAYERGSYGGQGQPQVATTKSEAARAVNGSGTRGNGEQTSHKGAAALGAGVAGAAVADAGFEGTKADRAHPHTEDPAYKTSRVHGADDPVYKTHPTKTEETTKTTTAHKTDKAADKAAKKSASKAAPAQRVDESAYAAPAQSKAAQPSTAKYGDVDVPPGNDYGKGVKDPRYGLPMAAGGISAAEAAALRKNNPNVAQSTEQAAPPYEQDQAYAARPSTADQAYSTQPTTANQAYATQPASQAEQHAAKSTTKEEKPSRRSSILGFLRKSRNIPFQSKH